MDFLFLDLQLTVSGGAYSTVGDLQLFCWLRAFREDTARPARGKMVALCSPASASALTTAERELEPPQIEALAARLERLRFPCAKPRVEEVFDTSDSWQHVVLRATLNDETDTLELSLCSSGFDGEDAAALRDFFRLLLEIAGVPGPDGRKNLTGFD